MSEYILSDRVYEIMESLADGLSKQQVANKYSLSRHTVNEYSKRAYKRFGINNIIELVKLFETGQIKKEKTPSGRPRKDQTRLGEDKPS